MATLVVYLQCMNIRQINFFNNYKNVVTPKNQVYLHHTAGADNAEQVFKYWQSDATPVATCVVIGRDGQIVQGFPSEKWAFHLGLSNKHFAAMGVPYRNLDERSIGVELCAWGQLTSKDGKFYNYVGGVVPADQVCTLSEPFRGYVHYHKYTQAQIDSVKELLLRWHAKYGIPLGYNENMWDVNKDAMGGVSGVWAHVSVRKDKVDVYPDPDLIEMLKSL